MVVILSTTNVLFEILIFGGVADCSSARRAAAGSSLPAGPSPTQAADAMGRPASSRGCSASASAAWAAAAAAAGPPGRPRAAAAAA